MYIIAQAQAAQAITQAAAALSTTSQALIFNVIAGEPGAGAQLGLNAPGSNRLNGQRFKVRAAGGLQLGAGTYTATVQPLLYASKTAGFTAGAASAIVSAAAVAIVVGSAAASNYLWEAEAEVQGDNASGKVQGNGENQVNNSVMAEAVLVNNPTSVDFSAEPPLQFSAGVTLVGAVAGSVASLAELNLEA